MSEDVFSGEKSTLWPDATANVQPGLRFLLSLAAVGLIFGLAAMLLLPYGLLRFNQGSIAGDFRALIMDETVSSPSANSIWLLFSSLAGAGLGSALMIGAIGAIRLKSWSLIVLRLWAISSITLGAGGSYFYFRWILPPWREQWAQVRGVDDTLVNLWGWMFGSILAIAMLMVTSRARVREAMK